METGPVTPGDLISMESALEAAGWCSASQHKCSSSGGDLTWTLGERPFDPEPGCLSPRAPGFLAVEQRRPAAQPGSAGRQLT